MLFALTNREARKKCIKKHPRYKGPCSMADRDVYTLKQKTKIPPFNVYSTIFFLINPKSIVGEFR